jgi:hypothetical protein
MERDRALSEGRQIKHLAAAVLLLDFIRDCRSP